ncbi:phytoene desaturase [Sediminihabitans luteus]|uniref:Phytoene desaturase n=1 Tax=Sediminihabitans luteus TaxID=1138585 RepID=A0A2M9D070_9CELL|nr:phytoene desaturase family protein [Sediminihabitans luteus]PJJ77596.1 phytoene desaturase [Sediminihabitans luteus]GII98496.1 phytoene desaturase [Sediminihabitans luteus]
MVVGGGVAGLATAALLAHGGAQVTVVERGESVGGRAGTLEVDGFRFDTGPSWYFMPEVFEHYFAMLGEDVADHLDLVPLDPGYRVFFEPSGDGPSTGDDRLDVTRDPVANAATFDRLEPGAGERVTAYARRASEAYRLALDHFLYTTFARLDRAVDGAVLRRLPRLATLLTRTLAQEAARAVRDPRLRQVLGYHAVFLGSSPYRVPALYSLMSHLDLVDGVQYPRGGMYTLVEALERLARERGVTIRTSTEVEEILVDAPEDPDGRPRRDAFRRVGLRHLGRRPRGRARGVRLAGGEELAADVVVSAADLHHTETALLPQRYADLPAPTWDRSGPGISAMLVMAGVRGELPELAHHSLFFTRDWPGNFAAVLGDDRASAVRGLDVPSPASLYVSRTSATDHAGTARPAAPAGHENLFVLVPFPADESLGADDASQERLERLADAALDQVAAWAGVDDLRERVVTRRVVGPAHFHETFHAWRGTALGMEHTLRQSAMFRPGNASRRVEGLYRAGSGTVPGVGLPMCVISAELVAKRLLGETSARPLPVPLRRGYLGVRG